MPFCGTQAPPKLPLQAGVKVAIGQQLRVVVASEGCTLAPVVEVVDVNGIERKVRVVDVANAADGELVLSGRRSHDGVTVGRQDAVFGVGVLVANLLGQ